MGRAKKNNHSTSKKKATDNYNFEKTPYLNENSNSGAGYLDGNSNWTYQKITSYSDDSNSFRLSDFFGNLEKTDNEIRGLS